MHFPPNVCYGCFESIIFGNKFEFDSHGFSSPIVIIVWVAVCYINEVRSTSSWGAHTVVQHMVNYTLNLFINIFFSSILFFFFIINHRLCIMLGKNLQKFKYVSFWASLVFKTRNIEVVKPTLFKVAWNVTKCSPISAYIISSPCNISHSPRDVR